MALTARQQERVSELLKKGVGQRTALALADRVTDADVTGGQYLPWAKLTQAEYDALSAPDEAKLYIIVG